MAVCLLFCFILLLLIGTIWVLEWPSSTDYFLTKKKNTFSSLSQSPYLMRKTSVDIIAFLGVRWCFYKSPWDRNMIVVTVLLSLSRSLPLILCVHLYLPLGLFCRMQAPHPPPQRKLNNAHNCLKTGIVSKANLASCVHSVYLARSASAVTSAHLSHPWVNIPITSQRRPVSIYPVPRPSSYRGSPEAAPWPSAGLSYEAWVSGGKEKVTGDF